MENALYWLLVIAVVVAISIIMIAYSYFHGRRTMKRDILSRIQFYAVGKHMSDSEIKTMGKIKNVIITSVGA